MGMTEQVVATSLRLSENGLVVVPRRGFVGQTKKHYNAAIMVIQLGIPRVCGEIPCK